MVPFQESWIRWENHRDINVLVEEILMSESVWNDLPGSIPGVSSSVSRHLAAIVERGAATALQELFALWPSESD